MAPQYEKVGSVLDIVDRESQFETPVCSRKNKYKYIHSYYISDSFRHESWPKMAFLISWIASVGHLVQHEHWVGSENELNKKKNLWTGRTMSFLAQYNSRCDALLLVIVIPLIFRPIPKCMTNHNNQNCVQIIDCWESVKWPNRLRICCSEITFPKNFIFPRSERIKNTHNACNPFTVHSHITPFIIVSILISIYCLFALNETEPNNILAAEHNKSKEHQHPTMMTRLASLKGRIFRVAQTALVNRRDQQRKKNRRKI